MRNRLWVAAIGFSVALIVSAFAPPVAARAHGAQVAINFDDVTAPCLFAETVALRNAYPGVHFKARPNLDGGGIVNHCGNFDVFGYSPPNFLAFNTVSEYVNGGVPIPPEVIAFDSPMSHVQVNVGSRFGLNVIMWAFDSSGHRVGTSQLIMTNFLHPLSIDATGIVRIIIDSRAQDWVLDDLIAS